MSGAYPNDIPNDGAGWAIFDPDRLHEQIIEAGDEWSDKEGAASLLEECRKPLLAKLGVESGEKTESGKERAALACPAYEAHIRLMVDARTAANKAKVRWIAVQSLSDNKRTQESTRRAALSLR